MDSTGIIPQPMRAGKRLPIAAARPSLAWFAVALATGVVTSLAAAEPPADSEPILRVETTGPLSYTTGLAFDPNGQLYGGGFDKSVLLWRFDPTANAFERDPRGTIRVPIGPGLQGGINAMAMSPDGAWLAVAGRGRIRGTYSFKHRALVVPAGSITEEMRRDEGVIHVFHRRTGVGKVLRGHEGPVLALAFVQSGQAQESRLISLGVDTRPNSGGKRVAIAWDAATGRLIAQTGAISGTDNIRPQLAAGDIEGSVVAAIPSGDTTLAIWNLAANKISDVKMGPYCTSAALSPDRRTLCVGGFGELRLLDATRLSDGVPKRTQSLGAGLPVVLSTMGDRPDNWRLAAMVLETPVPNSSRIVVRILKGRDLSDDRPAIPLWTVPQQRDFPNLAVSRDARWIAAAGHPSQDLLVLDANDPKASGESARRIRSEAMLFQQAQLARRGDAWGIQLVSADGASRVLDLATRQFTSSKDWRWDVSRPTQWTLQMPSDATSAGPILVQPRQGAGHTLPTPPSHRVTAAALHAFGEKEEEPIVARATMFRGEPILEIISARLGIVVRKLTGHTSSISSLAFSADGRLLISAGNDRTVRVFATGDLKDQHLGKRGGLPDVAFAERKEGLSVVRIGADSSANSVLRVGDVVRGLDRLGDVESTESVESLVNRLAGFRPGESVILHIRRGGENRAQPVQLGQAIDEINPLFTLLVIAGSPPGGDPSWIGWSSIGPYEASDAMPDRFLGWHFNESQGDALSARFVPISEYRQMYSRPGLLMKLLDAGAATLESLQVAAPIARPNIWVGLETTTGDRQAFLDSRSPILVDSPRVRLLVSLLGAGSERIHEVTWTSGDHKGRMAPTKDAEWSAEWEISKPGTQSFDISLTTDETPPQVFVESAAVRYEPAPPVIQVESLKADVVREDVFPVEFRVQRPAKGSWPTLVRVLHRRGDKETVVREDRFHQDQKQWREKVKLAPGSNVITISAVHGLDDAERSTAERATTQRLAVTYNPRDATPPEIRAELLDAAGHVRKSSDDAEPIRFTSREAVLRGEIEGREVLASATVGSIEELSPAEGFQPLLRKEVSFQRTFKLNPGLQTLVVAARTEQSVEKRSEWLVEYVPEVPDVTIIEPIDGTMLQDALDVDTVPMRAKLTAPPNQEAYVVSVSINGEKVGGVSVDRGAGTVEAAVPLRPGDNRIKVETSNPWGGQRAASGTITRRRPPRIAEHSFEKSPAHPRADVHLLVRSPGDLPPTRVKVGDLERSAEITRDDSDSARWHVRLAGVPLNQGTNDLVVEVGNADGWSRPPARLRIEQIPPPPAKAVVEFVKPTGDLLVTRNIIEVAMRVESESPLERWKLFLDGREAWTSDPSPGPVRMEKTVTVALTPGVNVLSLVVGNAGGETEKKRTVNFVPPPAHVAVDEIELSDSTSMRLELDETGRYRTQSALPEGSVVLKGRVQVFQRIQRGLELTAWVNGFRQAPITVAPPSMGEPIEGRPFAVPILLDRAGENLVQLTLPDDAEDEASDLEIVLPCEKPVRDRDLYVVAIAADVETMSDQARRRHEESLRERVLRIVGAVENPSTRRWETRVFSTVTPFVRTGRVNNSVVGGLVRELYHRLRTVDSRRPVQRAVMILCEGQIVRRPDGSGGSDQVFLLPSRLPPAMESPDPELFGFSPDKLVGFIGRMPGAHIVCYEVRRKLDEARWSDASRELDDINLATLKLIQARNAAPSVSSLFDVMKQGIARNQTLREVDQFIVQSVRAPGLQAAEGMVYESNIPRPLSRMILGPAQE